MRRTHRRQAGFTLIEIMISLVLGLVLLAGLFSVYLATKRSYTMAEALASRQETVRYVFARMAADTRMAGYRGCLPDTGEIRNTVNPDPAGGGRTEFTHGIYLYRFERYVEGFDGSGGAWQPSLPATIASAVADTDVLTIRAAFDPDVYVVKEMPTTSADIKTNPLNPAPFANDDILLITDCGGAAIFQLTNYNLASGSTPNGVPANFGNIVHNTGAGAPGNWTKDLGRKYPVGSQILRISTVSYYIRNSDNGTGPALWRDVDGTAQEIAEGVENMQVLYGVDTNADRVPDVYRTADTFADTDAWRQVVTARIALLIAGTRDYAAESDNRTFTLLGVTVGPFSDRRLRRVVEYTFSLRNRLP